MEAIVGRARTKKLSYGFERGLYIHVNWGVARELAWRELRELKRMIMSCKENERN